MRRYRFVLFFLAAGLFLAGLHPVPPQTFDLSGRITDLDTGLPIADARLTVLNAATDEVLADGVVTDADGRYSVSFSAVVANEPAPDLPNAYRVEGAYPNPVAADDGVVRIRFATPGNRPETPVLELFDALGRSVNEDGVLAGGLYFYRLQFPGGHQSTTHAVLISSGGSISLSLEQIPSAKPSASKRASELEIRCIVTKPGYATHSERLGLQTGSPNVHDVRMSAAEQQIEVGPPVQVTHSVVTSAGGTISVAAAGTPVDGMQVDVPGGAYQDTRTFEISYSEILGHDLGEFFHPISPLISVRNGGGYADEPITVTIPVTVPQGHFAMAFFYNEGTGSLEGLPLLDQTASSVTVMTRHFATSAVSTSKTGLDVESIGNLVVTSIQESVLAGQQVIDTGFRPGVDDWEFVNRGSYIAKGGHCAGQSMSAMWYYYEKKLKGAASLYHQFDDLNVSKYVLWQDNPRGYRFASVVQADLDWDGWIRTKLVPLGEPANQSLGWKAFSLSMLLTGEPQYVKLSRLDQSDPQNPRWVGHAIIAYKVSLSDGKLYVADPNFPGEERSIQYENEQFTPYGTKQNDAEPDVKGYTHIGYLSKSSMADWSGIGERWKEFLDGSIGTKAPNTFPDYTLLRVVDGQREELPDALDTDIDSIVVELKCPTCSDFYPGTDHLQAVAVYDEDGALLAVGNEDSKGQAVIKLKPGENRLGIYVIGMLQNPSIWDLQYVDFRWVTVYRQAPLFIYPDIANAEFAPIFMYGTPGQPYLLQAIHFNTAPPDARFVWDFGDGTDPVTVVGDSTVTYAFEDVGSYTVTLTLTDAVGAELGRATAQAQFDWFRGQYRMSRFDLTDQTGVFGEPYVATIAGKFANFAAEPANLVLDFSYWEDGEINLYLSYLPPNGDSETYIVMSNDPGAATDLPSFVDRNATQLSGRLTFMSGGGQGLAMGWFEITATQDRTTITGTLTLNGRRYSEDANGQMNLLNEGSVTYSFEADSFNSSFDKALGKRMHELSDTRRDAR